MKKSMIGCVLIGLLAVAGMTGGAQAAVWNATTGGNWSDTTATGWNGAYPNGTDAVADFSQRAFANGSIFSLDTSGVKVGSLLFGRTAYGYVLLTLQSAAGETLTLDSTTTAAITVQTMLQTGVTITTPLAGSSNVNINVGASPSLYVGLTLSGQNTYSGDTYLQTGMLRLGASTTLDGGGNILSGPVGTGTLHLAAGVRLGSTGADQVIKNAISLDGDFTFGSGTSSRQNKNVDMTGPATLTGNRALVQDAASDYYKVIFDGAIGQDAPGRTLTLTGGKLAKDVGNRDQLIFLNGNNTYTGATTVLLNRVVFAGDNTAATGDFVVKAGAIAELDSAHAISSLSNVSLEYNGTSYGILDMTSNVTVASLTLNGVAQPAGTYGMTGSGATYILDDYFSYTSAGTKILTVTPVPEPVTAALLALGVPALLAGRWRRK